MGSLNKIYLPLERVDSEHCAMIVDKGLGEIPEIKQHRVELNNHRAAITTDHPDVAISRPVAKIRQLGYGVSTLKQTFPVLNLSCASCASSTETILRAQPGVLSAVINYANATAQVEYIPGITDPQRLRTAVQSIGYDLAIDETPEAAEALASLQQSHYRSLKRRAFGAIALAIPLVAIGMTPGWMEQAWAGYAMWALATPVVFVFGRQFFVGAFRQAKHRSANMDTLVALSTGVAYLFRVFNTLFP